MNPEQARRVLDERRKRIEAGARLEADLRAALDAYWSWFGLTRGRLDEDVAGILDGLDR